VYNSKKSCGRLLFHLREIPNLSSEHSPLFCLPDFCMILDCEGEQVAFLF
jgi:hypothetical protein